VSETPERHEFGAEVGRLLDLVVHALYSEREIFLRELVANAAGAVDRRRFEALTQPGLTLPAEASLRITPDMAARRITLSDPGIGMTKAELAEHLGTIARSGTRAFAAAIGDAVEGERPNLIGQFGVGFYSAFIVADRVTLTSRRAGLAQFGQATCFHVGWWSSGLPGREKSTSCGNSTGNWSAGTGSAPQSSQWMTGIGQPQ
jgi:molecular chaperone HtpG